MPYKKKNLTPLQRSEIARKANAARKNRRGGRPKGSANAPSETRKTPKVIRSIGVYEEDYGTFRRIADYIGKTMADTMHGIAEGRKEANPKIFARTSPPDVSM